MTEQQQREAIVRVGRLLFDKGWVASTEGNLSVRLDADRILATPTGVSKGMLAAEALLITDLEGRKLAGEAGITSELDMHLAVYRTRPDARAVVHAHPPTATGFAAAGRALDQGVLPEVIVGLGMIPLAPYAQPGTPALGESVIPLIAHYDALLLENHGAVTCGPDLMGAYFRMETVEQFAKILLVAEQLGGPRLLPGSEIQKLFDARPRYGVVSHNTFTPGAPKSREDL